MDEKEVPTSCICEIFTNLSWCKEACVTIGVILVKVTCRLAIPGSFFLVSDTVDVGGEEYRLTYLIEGLSDSSLPLDIYSVLMSELSLCE